MKKESVTHTHTHTLLSSLSVPAEDHRGSRPADGGRPGVHLQLRARWPAQHLLWHPGVSATEGLRVRHTNSHTPTHTHAHSWRPCMFNTIPNTESYLDYVNSNIKTLKRSAMTASIWIHPSLLSHLFSFFYFSTSLLEDLSINLNTTSVSLPSLCTFLFLLPLFLLYA